jgi:hypothetical protein
MKIITILLIGFIIFNILMILKSAYGQNTTSSMLDKLLEDAKKEMQQKAVEEMNIPNYTTEELIQREQIWNNLNESERAKREQAVKDQLAAINITELLKTPENPELSKALDKIAQNYTEKAKEILKIK